MSFADAWQRAKDIDGWFSEQEGQLLYETAKAALNLPWPFLEIGSYLGRSASLLACHQRLVVLIDSSWVDKSDMDLYLGNIRQQQQLAANLVGLAWVLVPATSTEALLGSPQFGLVFIDGDHNMGGVDKDCEKYLPLIPPGGYAAFHDYSDNFPAVPYAVDLYTATWDTVGFVDSLIVKRRPA